MAVGIIMTIGRHTRRVSTPRQIFKCPNSGPVEDTGALGSPHSFFFAQPYSLYPMRRSYNQSELFVRSHASSHGQALGGHARAERAIF
jgi:hypothetical protein